MTRLALALLPLLVAASACLPGASLVTAPTFEVRSATLARLEPPGVGGGAAVVQLELSVRNPNPVGLRLAALDGELILGGRRVAAGRFPAGVSVPARGAGRLTLEIAAPLTGAPHLAGQMARLLAGESVAYRLDGAVAVEAFGTTQRLPTVTVARGELAPPGPLRPPTVRLDLSSSAVRLDGLTARVEVGLAIDNPLVVGFLARGPEVEVRLAGRPVGRASLPPTPVPARSATVATLRVEAGAAELGAALLARLRGGATGLELAVTGDLAFEIPGVASTSRALRGVAGTVR
jgi:hypothetical protein